MITTTITLTNDERLALRSLLAEIPLNNEDAHLLHSVYGRLGRGTCDKCKRNDVLFRVSGKLSLHDRPDGKACQ